MFLRPDGRTLPPPRPLPRIDEEQVLATVVTEHKRRGLPIDGGSLRGDGGPIEDYGWAISCLTDALGFDTLGGAPAIDWLMANAS